MGIFEVSALKTFLVLVLLYQIVLVIDYKSICRQKDNSKLE